jgi:hypothetical protein
MTWHKASNDRTNHLTMQASQAEIMPLQLYILILPNNLSNKFKFTIKISIGVSNCKKLKKIVK